ncbi:GntR family transcriptional regulator [Mucilaginibacter phyllosphaerae]|uniref:DNA-binding transcriptional regulator YhcF (GntR family) n=1 Tax=Mucilaginibacter phyllosphaerae TaxID=1812349 RepID=A0A4Y8AFA1_9SPHI|nr:GntR family transcriptional regulator [Mucilaginibacter phyllosphaerae]MBB3968927.1 DNA-binding transcriptional regulator YhcF (GntR family) [Mucilaginibacter phyllosphaerae]TEW67448.1 GntR family transcriptional regulator [Mucilaginibacter phyllosphaerae]GGH23495.1 transcriptional regulator [Mucilaginibacter phyllosphaerae]
MTKQATFYDFIKIDEYSATPKYLQLASSIINALEAAVIEKDYLLPSINELSFRFEISRDTIQKSYRHLKKIGVVNSFPGKGYCISDIDFKQKLRIFLLFNKLSAHKKIIYDSLVAGLGDDVAIDFYIYNNDFNLFKKLLQSKKDDYSHYVIIPHFMEGGENANEVINAIPKDKLILLDKNIPGITGEYSVVYENFEQDIYDALYQARTQLSKYHTMKLIFPEQTYFPVEIIKGFKHFCEQYAFNHEVIGNISSATINKGEVFISLMEDDLVILLERILEYKFKAGKDVGVISYNETPLKKVLLNGITTISTDFKYMGAAAAAMITEHTKKKIEVPFYYTRRASL